MKEIKEIKELHKYINYKIYRKPKWYKKYGVELGIILMILLFLLVLIFIELKFKNEEGVNAGIFGDFVGGYIGTLFTLISVLILYMTLRLQRVSSEVEKFENKFFELIRLHRDNITEIGIANSYGKKVFVMMMREFREAHKIIVELIKEFNLVYEKQDILKITYLVFFYGLGPNSSRILRNSLKKYPENFIEKIISKLEEEKTKVKENRKLTFTPFEGHQSRLGHYYRHLFQIIKYVDGQSININKYEYVKTLRAQLTNHEQALLFINSLTPLGHDWWEDGYIIKYRMVQNIPDMFFDEQIEIDITDYFAKNYFEWQTSIN